jgi:hypothetical protein
VPARCRLAVRGNLQSAHELRAARAPEMQGSRSADDSGMLEHLRESDNPAPSRRPSEETGHVSYTHRKTVAVVLQPVLGST